MKFLLVHKRLLSYALEEHVEKTALKIFTNICDLLNALGRCQLGLKVTSKTDQSPRETPVQSAR